MPYIFLGAAALLMIAAAVWRNPSPLLPWSYLVTGGAITLGDLVVTGMLTMYVYQPGFFPHYPDNYLGVLIAECLFVPAYYTFLASMAGRHRYLLFCGAVIPILLIEWLFLELDVYVHRSWTFWHSLVAFTLYSLAAAKLADAFERKGYTRRHRLILICATVYYAMNIWGLLPFGLLRMVTIRLNLVESAELDLVLSSLALHAVPFTLTGIVGTWYDWTRRPVFLGAVGVAFWLWLALLEGWGIWRAHPPWYPWVDGLLIVPVLAAIGWVDRWFAAHGGRRRRIPPWEPPV